MLDKKLALVALFPLTFVLGFGELHILTSKIALINGAKLIIALKKVRFMKLYFPSSSMACIYRPDS
tara:strand:- start:37 stop:234 length:198 start_codon:yes stop_codon:yes gene_type:complete